MSNEIVKTKRGKACKSHFQNYFLTEGNRNITFKKLDRSGFYIKLVNVNHNAIYPFTKKYCTQVRPKFELQDGIEYYIYHKDIIDFNAMSVNEQLDYLDHIMYDDLCIGMVDTHVIQDYLYNKFIKLDTEYKGNVVVSNLFDNLFWWEVKLGDDTIDIQSNRIIHYAENMIIEVTYIEKDKILSPAEELLEKTTELEGSGLIKVIETKYDQRQKGYSKIISVYAKNIIKEDNSRLFRIVFKNDIDIYSKFKSYIAIYIESDLDKQFDTPIAAKLKNFISKRDNINHYITLITDSLEKLPDEEYRKIANCLKTLMI